MKYQNVVYGIEMSDPVARLILASLGAAITLSSGAVRTYPMFLPEIRRRERVVVDWVNKRGKELGLKSRFTFGFSDWSPGGSVGGGSYESSVSSRARASIGRTEWSGPTGHWASLGSRCWFWGPQSASRQPWPEAVVGFEITGPPATMNRRQAGRPLWRDACGFAQDVRHHESCGASLCPGLRCSGPGARTSPNGSLDAD